MQAPRGTGGSESAAIWGAAVAARGPVTARPDGVWSVAMRVAALLSLLPFLVVGARAQAWVEIATSARPSPGFRAMAFDPVRERLVCVVDETVFVGPGGTTGRLVVWEWDGSGWLRIDTPTTVTTENRAVALAWDPQDRRMLCLGYLQNGAAWAYDGIDWQAVMPQSGSWQEPSLCFDRTRSVMVAVQNGGISERVGNQWVFRSALPLPLLSTVAAFDPQSGTVLLHGGLGMAGPVSTTWSWNGTTLQQVATTLAPPARYGHTFVADPVSGRLLVCGGRGAAPAPIDSVLAWTGSDWLVEPPLPQAAADLVAAPFAGAVRLLANGAMWTRQTGGAYTTLPLPATSPPGPCAFDPLRQRTVGVGDGMTHEFDGYAWTRTNVPQPGSFTIAGMTWHAGLGQVVAIDDQSNLFAFDGTSWAPLPATNKPGVAWRAFTYDEQRQCLAMAVAGDVHTMANGTWSLEPALPLAVATFRMGLAYDHATQRLVCSGGFEVFARTANGWTPLPSFPGGPVLQSDLVSDGTTLWAQAQIPVFGADRTFRFAGSAWSLVGSLNGAAAGAPNHDGVRGTLMLHGQDEGFALASTVGTSTRFGAGCSNLLELPRLHAPTRPGIGQRVLLDLDRCAPSAIAGLFVDFAAASVPLPGGCTLLLPAPTLLAVDTTNAHGGAGWSWSVPPMPSLRGATVYHQALVLTQNGAFPGLGDLSNGVQLLVGD